MVEFLTELLIFEFELLDLFDRYRSDHILLILAQLINMNVGDSYSWKISRKLIEKVTWW